MRQDQERELREQIAAGEKREDDIEKLPLPRIPYVSTCVSLEEIRVLIVRPSLQYRCRQIMTRTDFLEGTSCPGLLFIAC